MILPICNKKPERAPRLFGHTFILCWRCTGLVVGAIIGNILKLYIGPINALGYLLLIPTGIDGILQYKFGIMSNNFRRFTTGIIGGLVTWV